MVAWQGCPCETSIFTLLQEGAPRMGLGSMGASVRWDWVLSMGSEP